MAFGQRYWIGDDERGKDILYKKYFMKKYNSTLTFAEEAERGWEQ